ncbi:MAG: hypothetical protein JWM27_2348 [Gemmatimonadetes bacterium]|nr:hypothetical protein [Gemmatimonadota bacterium]
MRSIVRVGLLAAACLALAATGAGAQGRNVPGTVHSDVTGELSDYRKEVRQHADEIIGQWRDAWGNRDAGVLAALYARDAVLVPLAGQPLHGQREIRAGLPAVLGRAGPISTTRLDFGTSGDLAYDVEQFTFAVEEAGRTTAVHTGILVNVLKRRWDGRWEIQSQSLALSPDATD